MRKYLLALTASLILAVPLYSQAHPNEGIDDYYFEVLWRLQEGSVGNIEFYDNDTKIVYSRGNQLKMLDAATGGVIPFLYEFPAGISDFTISGDTAFLCGGDFIQQIDLKTGQMIRQFDVIDIYINGIEKGFGAVSTIYSKNKNRLYVLGGYKMVPFGTSRHVLMYDLNSETPEKIALRLPIDTTIYWRYFALSPDEGYLVLTEDEVDHELDKFRAVVYETANFTQHWKFNAYDPETFDGGMVKDIMFSPVNSDLIFNLGMYPQLFIVDIYNKTLKSKYALEELSITGVAPFNTQSNVVMGGKVAFGNTNAAVINYAEKQFHEIEIPRDEHALSSKLRISQNDSLILGGSNSQICLVKIKKINSVYFEKDTLEFVLKDDLVTFNSSQVIGYNTFNLASINGNLIKGGNIDPLGLVLPLSKYPAGIYFLTLSGNNKHKTYKILWSR